MESSSCSPVIGACPTVFPFNVISFVDTTSPFFVMVNVPDVNG